MLRPCCCCAPAKARGPSWEPSREPSRKHTVHRSLRVVFMVFGRSSVLYRGSSIARRSSFIVELDNLSCGARGTEKCDFGVRPKTGTRSRKRLRNPLLLDLGAARQHCSPRVSPRPPKVTKMTPTMDNKSKKNDERNKENKTINLQVFT